MLANKNKLPNLFLVGAPKCGTTALSHYLAGHPDIFMSEQAGWKEPGYYAADQHRVFGMRPIHTREDYLALFAGEDADKPCRGEASIIYLASRVAIPSLLQDSPDALFVVAVRNPIELAQGLHNQRVKEGSENILDFEDAWHAQENRMNGKQMPPQTNMSPEAFHYGKLASIGTQLTRLLGLVSRERVHVIVHDDLKVDPAAVYDQLLKFLGLANDGRDEFGQLNKSKKVRYPTLLKVLYFANRVRKRLGIPGMGKGLYRRTYQLGLTEGKAELRPEFRKELQDYFKDEVRILSELLERDLDHWLADG